MSFFKNLLDEKEKKHQNSLNGYRIHLMNCNDYNMECPYCCNALSNSNVKEKQCLHCGHVLPWNED